MIVLGGMMSLWWVEIIKVRKESNISSLLLFLVYTLFLYLLASGQLFESDSILLHTWRKFGQHIPPTGCIHHPPDRENINIFNGPSHMKGDTNSFHSTSLYRGINQRLPTSPLA